MSIIRVQGEAIFNEIANTRRCPCRMQLSRVVREPINISRCIVVQQHEQRRGSFNKHNPTNATHMEM